MSLYLYPDNARLCPKRNPGYLHSLDTINPGICAYCRARLEIVRKYEYHAYRSVLTSVLTIEEEPW